MRKSERVFRGRAEVEPESKQRDRAQILPLILGSPPAFVESCPHWDLRARRRDVRLERSACICPEPARRVPRPRAAQRPSARARAIHLGACSMPYMHTGLPSRRHQRRLHRAQPAGCHIQHARQTRHRGASSATASTFNLDRLRYHSRPSLDRAFSRPFRKPSAQICRCVCPCSSRRYFCPTWPRSRRRHQSRRCILRLFDLDVR
ncbi:hypothetical protein OBBRIDRAFT_237962 [Obba rivulosa]|uniref:Uncharacterized protein n=1 Tax=Obba rivulosa TaxID=1052685 RepID=A0A8E2DQN1_9APHY|nr:hypothetical protein OBBRIDRAFT_237962 [Obba rivulosa]